MGRVDAAWQIGARVAEAAETAKPTLEKAGATIKTTATSVAEQAAPVAEKVGASPLNACRHGAG